MLEDGTAVLVGHPEAGLVLVGGSVVASVLSAVLNGVWHARHGRVLEGWERGRLQRRRVRHATRARRMMSIIPTGCYTVMVCALGILCLLLCSRTDLRGSGRTIAKVGGKGGTTRARAGRDRETLRTTSSSSRGRASVEGVRSSGVRIHGTRRVSNSLSKVLVSNRGSEHRATKRSG